MLLFGFFLQDCNQRSDLQGTRGDAWRKCADINDELSTEITVSNAPSRVAHMYVYVHVPNFFQPLLCLIARESFLLQLPQQVFLAFTAAPAHSPLLLYSFRFICIQNEFDELTSGLGMEPF